MIDERLLELDYYLDKLSLYFRNCYGIQEQFAMIHRILVTINSSLDTLFNNMNILEDDALSIINTSANSTTESDVLDKLATVYGVSRTFSVSYTSGLIVVSEKQLTLDNYELLMLIRARIIQNTYKGSYEECRAFYSLIGLADNIIINNAVNNATCDIYLKPMSSTLITSNITDMFLAGLLTLQSLGIQYNHNEYDVVNLALWDSGDWDDSSKTWY